MTTFESSIFDASISFEERALRVFAYQFEFCKPYHIYCSYLGKTPTSVHSVQEIPLYPIRAFKETTVFSAEFTKPDLEFRSSGTSKMERSRHLVAQKALYEQAILQGLNPYFDLKNTIFLTYLPGYLENPHSSLVWMMRFLVENHSHFLSQFLPLDQSISPDLLLRCEDSGAEIVLFGAAFGLLDLIELQDAPLPSSIKIIETGGMKTYRRERTREVLHKELSEGFGIPKNHIGSEYGMAELLSQGWQLNHEGFRAPHWMKWTVRHPKDASIVLPNGENGVLGIMDLANLYSCSFILTEDEAISHNSEDINVMGRASTADLRGCNFLIDRD